MISTMEDKFSSLHEIVGLERDRSNKGDGLPGAEGGNSSALVHQAGGVHSKEPEHGQDEPGLLPNVLSSLLLQQGNSDQVCLSASLIGLIRLHFNVMHVLQFTQEYRRKDPFRNLEL